MQILQGPHQVQTALDVLEQASMIETLANKTALLLDLLAWVANFPFNHLPLLQEDLDFRVGPWAKGRAWRDGTTNAEGRCIGSWWLTVPIKPKTWHIASLGSGVAQDLVQDPFISRIQAVSPGPLVTKTCVQVLHLHHHIKTAILALPQTPIREASAKGLGLRMHLIAWVSEFIFNHCPLLQQDPDFILSPRA